MRKKSFTFTIVFTVATSLSAAASAQFHGITTKQFPSLWRYEPELQEEVLAMNAPIKQKSSQQHVSAKSSWLPFWGDEARKRGYVLPEPFGVNVNYINIRQGINVDKISFAGLGFGSMALPSTLFDIQVGKTRQHSTTRTIKLDAWVLPFFNLYTLAGHTQGGSLSDVSVNADPNQFSGFDKLIAQAIHDMYQSGELKDIDFRLNFRGVTYGVGGTFAGGYENWFSLLDINYTQTRLDVLEGSINAATFSPRVGYRFTTPAIEPLRIGPGKLNVWVGSMYQNIQQQFKGNLSDLSMPPELQILIKLANSNNQGRFDVKQHLESPWNILLGMQYEMTSNFNVMTEVGFEQRNSFFISGEYRF